MVDPMTTVVNQYSPGLQCFLHRQRLIYDLSWHEVTNKPTQTRSTKGATNWASRLRRQAAAKPICVGQTHSFYPRTIMHFEQQLRGPVTAVLRGYDLRSTNLIILRQPCPKPGWKVGHVIKRVNPMSINPLGKLATPVRWLAFLLHQRTQFICVQSYENGFHDTSLESWFMFSN